MQIVKVLLASIAAIVLAVPGARAHDSASNIDPMVVEVLEGMEAYMAGFDQVELKALNSVDVRLEAGLMAGQASELHARARRQPSAFRATAVGDVQKVELYISGGLLTVFSPESKYYAQTEAPDSVGAALRFALEKLDIDAPMADYFRPDVADAMLTDVHTGLYLGLSRIRGVECHQLALRHPEADVQIWVSTGDRPLPQKVVITSIWESGSPRFTSLLEWNSSPTFSEETFEFTAPAGAMKIDFLR